MRGLVRRLQSPGTGNLAASSAPVEHLGCEIAVAVQIDRIQPAGMNVRMQQGKPAYSHVVTVIGPAKMIYIAGQLARDVDGNIVGPGDMRLQLE
jgi:enamine deaminase RidA (YjgF/YER057c/UK114 family)